MSPPKFIIRKTSLGAGSTSQPPTEFTPDKIIYVELDDEITHVFDHIKTTRGKRLALIVPKRALILQSIINLKILKKKIDDLEKEIVVVTQDTSGLALAEKAGIMCIDRLFEKDKAAPPPMSPLVRERPRRFGSQKVSLAEVIQHDEKPSVWFKLTSRIREILKKRKLEKQGTRIVFVTPNKQALFTLILVSIFLFLTIAYIALPGATIYLTPKASVLDPSFNITFLDAAQHPENQYDTTSNAVVLPSYTVSPPPFKKTFKRPATGKLFQGQNATGILSIKNTSGNPWDLAERTRFQTNDGIIFRIEKAVRVPAGSSGNPGTLDVTVEADPLDVHGQIVGARGNIPPSQLFLPGLRTEESRKKLYAENRSSFSGGVTESVKTITEEDIKAAKDIVERDIAKDATADLEKYLDQQNVIQKTNLSLLKDRNLITVSPPIINVPEDMAGKPLEEFEVNAQYTLRGVAYDRGQLIEILTEKMKTRVDPDKRLIKIDAQDLSYRFLDTDAIAGRIRLTATMRAIQMYELDPDKENGHRFLKKITDHILGMKVSDAVGYLQQQTDEIARVEIKTWPLWAPTIPNIADNIKFVVEEEGL